MNILISKNRILAFLAALGLVASSASAAVVWNLNPNSTEGPVGSDTLVLTSSGYQITARGYDFTGYPTPSKPSQLYFKSQGDIGEGSEIGLGLVNAPQNELFSNGANPADFIQLDLRAILAQGFTNGKIAVASLQNGESFQLFGSNEQGVLGAVIGLPFEGTAFDDTFVTIPGFGTFQFISVVGSAGNVLPARFAADMTPVPEMSALLPIVALLVVIGASSLLRRRRLSSSL